MPLRRESNLCDPEKFVGVTFAMLDDEGRKRVICRVTYEALCDRASFDGNGDDWLGAWRLHMKVIEDWASVNYDSEKPLLDGRVIVDTLQLTPLSREKSYFQA